MKNRNWIVVIGAFILLAGLVGAGVLLFQAGMARGASAGMEGIETMRPWMGRAPVLRIGLGILLLLFLLKFVARLLFFPLFGIGMHSRRWRTTAHGPWAHPGPWGEDQNVPPFFQAWHDQAHTESTGKDPSAPQKES